MRNFLLMLSLVFFILAAVVIVIPKIESYGNCGGVRDYGTPRIGIATEYVKALFLTTAPKPKPYEPGKPSAMGCGIGKSTRFIPVDLLILGFVFLLLSKRKGAVSKNKEPSN